MKPVLTWAPVLTALGGSLVLIACSKAQPDLPPVAVAPAPEAVSAPATAASGSVDPSVPAANSVQAPAGQRKVDPNAGRANLPLTPAQESTAMPLPGQNNDHSAPLPAAKRSTAP